jgi:murein DD-endopeptidase MepM/ murein hydrolase activator NlpD
MCAMRSILLITLILMAAPQRGAADAAARLRALAPDVVDGPTAAQQAEIEARLARRIAHLQRVGKLEALPSTDGTGLQWPLRPAPGFAEYGYYGTSNFPDHDPRFPDLLQDYTCGTRTYDLATGYNHHGTDYYLWPFPWRMMDLEQVHIVAAAPGVIVDKVDGNSDRSCAIAGNTGFNAVYVRQDDGLLARYLHMKRGSLTDKHVGDRVAAGDYLGLVGSSGPSSAPHLHFELLDGAGEVVDPHHGQCNDVPDRWAVFRPYESPRIATLSTHSAEPDLVECGVEDGVAVREDPHYQDRFAPGDALWAFAAYSDHRNGEITHFSILRPDGSAFAEWDFDLAGEDLPRPFYSGTAWDWSHTLPTDAPPGVWMLRAEFAEQVYEHPFEVVDPSATRGHSRHARPDTL